MALKMYKFVQGVLLAGLIAIVIVLFEMIVLLDMNPYVVVSGSMEPELPIGSVCIVNCQDREPEVGDIISYKAGDSVITHRVIEMRDEGYVTKGDSNNAADPGIIKNKQIFGVCEYVVPGVGYAVMYLRTIKGLVTVLAVVTVWGILGRLLEGGEDDE